ncbi:MAG: MotA/TolQ/ExbB proton channel family protein [Bacteroidaceae bacterium]|nr:MotA/TolQ/ExbB proton channel family protein [Bacteroidaceae bacterium]MBQ9883163.1 MotA/TolQ/ExbB proton channel family protein [Bacteroidaceae bacterium]
METISNALFWISNGLMVPVALLLLLMLAKALWETINFFGEFYQRMKGQRAFDEALEDITPTNAVEKLQPLVDKQRSALSACLGKLLSHRDNAAYCERLLSNYEVDAEKELAQSRSLVKLGPMLGLMGTLIPMGPALVGLAAGDISSMAYNMQVAFATTVVGIVIAAVGVVILQVKQRWYAHELNDLEYLSRTLRHETE